MALVTTTHLYCGVGNNNPFVFKRLAEVVTKIDRTSQSMTYLLSGNIFHGSMGLDQLFTQRPSYSAPAYSSPVSGLYLCGSGAHPGKIWNSQGATFSQGAPMRGDNFSLCRVPPTHTSLYVCYTLCHCIPGGGVMGAPGKNCARVVLNNKRIIPKTFF